MGGLIGLSVIIVVTILTALAIMRQSIGSGLLLLFFVLAVVIGLVWWWPA